MKKSNAVRKLVVILITSLSLIIIFHKNINAQTLADLPIGSIVVDNTWQWDHRPLSNYSGSGEEKPIKWIVVDKNHYGLGGTAVTLLSLETIANYTFDNNSIDYFFGSSHYGDSGSLNEGIGIRKFLNGSAYIGPDSHDLETKYPVTVYDTIGEYFKSKIVTTTVPCAVWDTGAEYTTQDKIFLPSQLELGGGTNSTRVHSGEEIWEYFNINAEAKRATTGVVTNYMTRSPDTREEGFIRYITADGSVSYDTADTSKGVRLALNLSSDTFVSGGTGDVLAPYTIEEPVEEPEEEDEGYAEKTTKVDRKWFKYYIGKDRNDNIRVLLVAPKDNETNGVKQGTFEKSEIIDNATHRFKEGLIFYIDYMGKIKLYE